MNSDPKEKNNHFNNNTSQKYPLLVRRQPITNHPQCRNPFPQQNKGDSRLIQRTGKYNVSKNQTPEFWIAHIRDFSHTLVESSWKWILLAFISSYVLCWLLFAWFYELVAIANGDHDGNYTSSKPCLVGINSFTGYYLFSLETQHTVGFGSRYITDNCVEGVFILSMQVILGSAICGGMATLVYTKMVKPENQNTKKLFAKNAVICQRNGRLCLLFRVRDLEKRHQIGTKITAYMIENRKQSPFLRSFKLETPGFLLWPIELCHIITPSSPLWKISAKDFLKMRVEFILTMEGTSISTGQASTTKTSYVSSEVLWGHRFKPCIRYDSDMCSYVVNQDHFHETEEVITPLCSGRELQKIFDYFYDSPHNSMRSWKYNRISTSSASSTADSAVSSDFAADNGDKRALILKTNNGFINEVVRKLSVISERSKEAVETDGHNEDDKKKKKTVDHEIIKLEEDVNKCLDDLKKHLLEIDKTEQMEKSEDDVEKLDWELENYNRHQ